MDDLTGFDRLQRDVNVAEGDVCASGWAAVEMKWTRGQRVEQWAPRRHAQAFCLGMRQSWRAGRCGVESS